jgi:HK97 family phage major capsid protein
MTGSKIIELKQERMTVTNAARDIMNAYEGKVLEAEKEAELKKLEDRADEITTIVDREEKQLARERLTGEKVNEEKAVQTPKNEEITAAFKNYIQSGSKEDLKIYNALSQDNPTQAGYLVAPEKFVFDLIADLNNTMFMRQKAKVLAPLQGAQSLGFPTRTARMAAAVWGTEIAAPTADTTLAFGKKEFKPNPSTAEILLSKTLIRNAPGVDQIIREELAYAFAELQENAYMTGTGAGRPLGLFTASVDGITTARDVSTGNTATEIKFDGLIEAKYSLKDQYQANAEWILSREAIKQIAKLKDSEGQYIWQPSLVLGAPDLILGKMVNSTEYAPHVFTTGLYVGIYGNLKNYWIVDSLAMEIQALFELYARTNQVDYIARLETDGQPVIAESFARIKLG